MASETTLAAQNREKTGRLIGLAILMRLTVDTTMRVFYPYLPEISRGLGISLAQGGFLMSARSIMILGSPAFGLWNDRRGPKLLLSGALLVQALCLGWISQAQGFWTVLPALMILGVTASAFIPIMQATISDYVPFHRRGRILGIVEFSWALTGLIVVPLLGLLMVAQGWRAPFRLLAIASLIVSPLPFLLPQRQHIIAQVKPGLRQVARLVWRNRSARAAIAVNGLMFLTAESFFVTYGAWLEQGFGLAPDQIGRIAGLLGLVELTASGASSLFIDRLGKRRGVGAGLLAMTVTMLALPWLDATLALAIIGLALFTLSFEFTIVSNIGLMSEQAPQARGTVLSLAVMATAITRTLSGYGGVALFEWQGMAGTATVTALAGAGLAFLVLWRWVEERGA